MNGRLTSLIGSGLRVLLARRITRLSDARFWAANTARLQRAQLRSLLRAAAGTEIGRAAKFAALAARDESSLVPAYQDALPLADYEAFRARLARMREHAEPDVLWPGVVMDWAQTSGTTGGQKYIPVSDAMMRSNFRAALDIFAHAARFGVSLPRLFAGKLFFLGGSTSLDVNARGIRTGDLSGVVSRLVRWPLSEVYLPGPKIALMDHWPSKMAAMSELGACEDVTMVSGMASWSLILFQNVAQLAAQRRTPPQPGGTGVSPVPTQSMSSSSTPPSLPLNQVWPNLQLFVHGGVKYAPFDPRVRDVWSGGAADIPYRLEVYPASEGFIAMQDTRHDPGLRLQSDIGIFYEFVPLEEIDRSGARAFTADQVEKGQRYVVVMTTCAGLWRYVIGDVVEFDTIPPAGPARLRIVGRHRHFVNAFGENLIVEEIENAVVAASRAAGITVGEFTAAPVYPGEGRRAGLELAVEIDGAARSSSGSGPRREVPCDTVMAFAAAFDEALRKTNVDYHTKRTGDLGMAPATVTVLPLGAFHRWMERTGKLGGQHKMPRCANHREFIDGLTGSSR